MRFKMGEATSRLKLCKNIKGLRKAKGCPSFISVSLCDWPLIRQSNDWTRKENTDR